MLSRRPVKPSWVVLIYLSGCNLSGWAGWGQKSQKIPSFIVKNGHETPPPKRWGFFMFQCFFLFLSSAVFCLGLSSLPLLLAILKPKNGPPNEVLIYLSLSFCSEAEEVQEQSQAWRELRGERNDLHSQELHAGCRHYPCTHHSPERLRSGKTGLVQFQRGVYKRSPLKACSQKKSRFVSLLLSGIGLLKENIAMKLESIAYPNNGTCMYN